MNVATHDWTFGLSEGFCTRFHEDGTPNPIQANSVKFPRRWFGVVDLRLVNVAMGELLSEVVFCCGADLNWSLHF